MLKYNVVPMLGKRYCDVVTTLPQSCDLTFISNVVPMLYQRHFGPQPNSTLWQRCLNVVCLLGSLLTYSLSDLLSHSLAVQTTGKLTLGCKGSYWLQSQHTQPTFDLQSTDTGVYVYDIFPLSNERLLIEDIFNSREYMINLVIQYPQHGL